MNKIIIIQTFSYISTAPDEKSLKHKTEDRPKSKTGKSKQELEVTGQQMNATKQSKKNSKLQIVQLPSYNSNQIKCIAKCGFFESIIPPGISVIIDRDIVELKGQDLKLLNVAKDETEKCMKDMTHTSTSISIIPNQADLLTQPKVVEFINEYLDIENSSVTWDIVKVLDQGTLVVYAFDKNNAEDMQIRILSCIVEVCVKMKDSKLEWFQTLLKKNEPRMIFTSNRAGDIIVYTSLDIYKKYFEGQTHSKSIKQPSNSDENKADNLTNSLGKVPNQSGPPAHQSAATNQLTNLEQCSGGINPMKESQLDKKGEQDIQAPGTKEKKKEYSDSVSVSEQQVEYIDEFLSEKLLNICKKGIDWDLIDSKIVLRGKEKHVISAKKEVVALLDSISCLSRQAYCGKPSVPGEFTQKWKQMGKEKKSLINAAKTKKPGVESGWVIATEKPKMHILYLKGPVHLADVDTVLCPVTDQFMPLGTSASLIKEGNFNIECTFSTIWRGNIKSYPCLSIRLRL